MLLNDHFPQRGCIECVQIGQRCNGHESTMPCRSYSLINNQKHFRIFLFSTYTALYGFQVRAGRRQSIPSSNIDNCARLSATVPLSACAIALRPVKPRRKSVIPAAIQMCAPAGTEIISPGATTPFAIWAGPPGPRLTPARNETRSEWYRRKFADRQLCSHQFA